MVSRVGEGETLKVLLIDHPTLLRSGVRMLLDYRPGLKVVGETADCEEALRLAHRCGPDIVLLEPGLDVEGALGIIPKLLRVRKDLRVIVLTDTVDPDTLLRAVSLGAMGIVRKAQTEEILLKAIERVCAGEVWIDRSMTARVLSKIASEADPSDPERGKIASLTVRERDVIALIGEGLKNKQIADRLFISEGTVRHHLRFVFQKLDVTDRLELVIYAYRYGLVQLIR